MTNTVAAFVLINITCHVAAQDFLGINTGNYAGVTGVMLQPASIVDSRHKFDINLFSTGVNYSNNFVSIDRSAILKFDKNNYSSYPVFKEKYLSKAGIGVNEKVFFSINNRTQLPLSFMVTTGKKSAIALNIQSRSMVQGRNITQSLANAAYGEFYPNATTGVIDASGFSLNTLNWAEIGFTYGRVLFSSNKHFLKAAVTAKYLGGISSLNLSSSDLRFGINADSSFNFNTSNTQYNHNKNAGFNNLFDRNFKPDANGFGYDAGLVYEFRGNIDKFKYISTDDQKSHVAHRRDANKYMFRVGISLLDAGRFSFSKPSNVNSFSSAITGWKIRNEKFKNLDNFDTALSNRVLSLANDPRDYNVYLPSALSVQLDIRFVKGFYLSVMSYNAVEMGKDLGFRFDKYDYYTITPRWESRAVGIYIPYTFGNHKNLDNYKGNLLGATLRLGSLFIGSSNLGTMAFSKNLKAADVHIGLKVGFTYGKPTKASRLLDKITGKNEIASQNDTTNITKPLSEVVEVAEVAEVTTVRKTDTTQRKPDAQTAVIIDYKNGQIFSDPSRSGNIIIINNNNYYYAPQGQVVKKDSIINNTTIFERNTDTLFLTEPDTVITIVPNTNKVLKATDTLQQRLSDSLIIKKRKLDSLIINLQQLRQQMDSIQVRNVVDTTIIKIRKTAATPGARLVIDTLAIAPKINDTLTNRFADSLSVQKRLSALKGEAVPGFIKKETDINEAGKKTPPNNKYSPQKEGIVFYDTVNKTDKEINDKRELDYLRYAYESNLLQEEIKALQNNLRRESRANNPANYVPAYIPKPTQLLKINKKDTLHIRDTISNLDTVLISNTQYIRDTVFNIKVKTDTIYKLVSPATEVVSTPERNETSLVKKEIKNIPTEIVLFGVGQSAIKKTYYGKLSYQATILKQDQQLYANITGYTDATGSLQVNRRLALKRANRVKMFFILKGIGNTHLIVNGEAVTVPVAGIKKASPQLRRVEIKILPKQ